MLSRNGVPTVPARMRISLLVILLAFCTVAAWSQASTSSVTGQVTDASNAAVVGAEVKMTDVATNASQTAMTNEAGRYIFVNVPSGTYNLIYSKSGFSQGKVMGQKVEVGSVLTLNTTLQVGATSTSIEIKASVGAELQTTNASVGTTLTAEALDAAQPGPRRVHAGCAAARHYARRLHRGRVCPIRTLSRWTAAITPTTWPATTPAT